MWFYLCNMYLLKLKRGKSTLNQMARVPVIRMSLLQKLEKQKRRRKNTKRSPKRRSTKRERRGRKGTTQIHQNIFKCTLCIMYSICLTQSLLCLFAFEMQKWIGLPFYFTKIEFVIFHINLGNTKLFGGIKNCFVVCNCVFCFFIFKSVLKMRKRKKRLLQCSPRFVQTKSQKSPNKSSCIGATKKRKANSMITKQNFEILEAISIKIKCYTYFDIDNYMGYDFYLNKFSVYCREKSPPSYGNRRKIDRIPYGNQQKFTASGRKIKGRGTLVCIQFDILWKWHDFVT